MTRERADELIRLLIEKTESFDTDEQQLVQEVRALAALTTARMDNGDSPWQAMYDLTKEVDKLCDFFRSSERDEVAKKKIKLN